MLRPLGLHQKWAQLDHRAQPTIQRVCIDPQSCQSGHIPLQEASRRRHEPVGIEAEVNEAPQAVQMRGGEVGQPVVVEAQAAKAGEPAEGPVLDLCHLVARQVQFAKISELRQRAHFNRADSVVRQVEAARPVRQAVGDLLQLSVPAADCIGGPCAAAGRWAAEGRAGQFEKYALEEEENEASERAHLARSDGKGVKDRTLSRRTETVPPGINTKRITSDLPYTTFTSRHARGYMHCMTTPLLLKCEVGLKFDPPSEIISCDISSAGFNTDFLLFVGLF